MITKKPSWKSREGIETTKKGERAKRFFARVYNMSVFDVMECKEKQENQKIRIAVNTWKQAGNPKTLDIVEVKVNQKKEKIKSLLFLVNTINRRYSDAFMTLMAYDKAGVIDEYVHDKMMLSGGRYMIPAEVAIYNATTEAVTQMILQDQKAQDLLDDILSEICPQFYSKKNSEAQTIRLIVDFIDKLSSKGKKVYNNQMCFSLEEDVLAFLYYIITWKIERNEDNDLAMLLHNFIRKVEVNPKNLLNERRTDTSFDWLAELLDMSPETLAEDKIFLKYQESCFSQAAKWLHGILEKDELIDIDGYEADFYIEQQNYRKFLFYIFKEMILKLQNIEDEEDVNAEAFGKNPLSAILNSLSEIKWYPKKIGSNNIEIAFNLAALSLTSSYAIISFEEDDLNKLERTNLIRKSSLRNPEQFVCSLFVSFVLHLISVECKHKDYETFSIGHDMELLMKKHMQEKNNQQTMQKQQDDILKLKEQEIERLKMKMLQLSEKQQDENKMLRKKIKPLESENRTLWKENEKLKEELEALKQKKAELESMIEAYEETIGKQEEVIENNEALTDEELRQQRVLFVGGRYELIRTLKNIMENAKFVQTEKDPIPDLNKIDRIIYFSNFVNHSTYNKVFDRAKVLSIPYQFIHTQNYEQVWGILKKKSI